MKRSARQISGVVDKRPDLGQCRGSRRSGDKKEQEMGDGPNQISDAFRLFMSEAIEAYDAE